MKKLLSLTLLAILFSFASYAQMPISGPTSGCAGETYYFNDSLSPGGTWSSSNPLIASINATTGVLAALTTGSVTVTYTLGGSVTAPFTIVTPPAPISETASTFCLGGTATCTDATSGGVWSSSDASIISIDPTTGALTATGGGIAIIFYSVAGTCTAITYDTVNSTYVGYLSAPPSICVGSTGTVVDSASGILTGGTWSTSDPLVATISTSGVVTGISGGTVTISYTVPGGVCGSGSATTSMVISTTTDAGYIYGTTAITVGETSSMSDYATSGYLTGGTWSSSDASIASIDPSTGVVTGIAPGSVTISYAVMGCGGIGTATTTVTVTAFDGISGNVLFGSGSYYGNVKVWLITYNPTTLDLEALDSTTVYCYGTTSVYYSFTGVPTDSFRIKASVNTDSSYVTTGYTPTYHTSSFYWDAANVLYHVSGTGDINQDINMAYGTTTTGTGFISGSVLAGADKGTSVEVPVKGMLIYAINASTNVLMQQTYTDATGAYSFTNLPTGATYKIYPEAINYATTAYTSISLTAGVPGMTAANFKQHTVSHTITPITEGVNNVNTGAASVNTYPNPTSGKLDIQWTSKTAEQGNVIITDLAGRQIYKAAINMNAGSGNNTIDLSSLTDGLYMISVKSANISYNSKIQVQH